MAIRYTVEDLLHLAQSPLCVKPNSLPPKEDWMGQTTETYRNGQGTGKTGTERTRNSDGSLVDQTNRRPGVDRHTSRNAANAEGIVLGPPRTTFSSSTLTRGNKPFDNEKSFASFRRNGDGEGDRFNERERGDRDRDGRGNYRRRGDDGEQDSDGWSTVKPRKSFGHEGAERFNGRMGGDRFGPERRPRDSQDESNDKPKRSNFGEFGRDKDGDDGERPRRNGLARNRTEQPPWSRGDNGDSDPPTGRERFDRAKSWRERAGPPEDQPTDSKPRDRNFNNRWDRDQRQERDPEWFDEEVEEKPQAHSIHDLQKFMESMKAQKKGDGGPEPVVAPTSINTSVRDNAFDIEAAKVKSAPAVEMGQDQFFAKFASTPSADIENPHELPKESAPPKPKGGSRFGSFFATQQGRQTEPSTPAAAPMPTQEPNPLLLFGGANVAANIASATQAPMGSPGGTEDKTAFQNILLKLKKQHISSTPPSGGFPAPAEPERGPSSAIASPGPYPAFGMDHREGPPSRGPPPEMLASRPQPPGFMPPGPMGTEAQLLQNLIAQRQPVASPAGGRDQAQVRNSQTEFLMSLMQSGRHAPEAQRNEPHIRMPQPSRPAQIPQTPDREPDFQRERSGSHQQGRPQGPPGFFDEPQMRLDQPRQQPTQILQRPISMGIEPIQPNWLQGANQAPPPPVPGRHMIPPPGLAGGPRNAPPPGMFPPVYPPMAPPMGAFPPEAMRNMAPPPGLFGGPGGPGGPMPPGFMPPGMNGGFPGGHDPLAFGFDGRGMPPPGATNFRRN